MFALGETLNVNRKLVPASAVAAAVAVAFVCSQPARAQSMAAVSATEAPFTRDAFYVGGTMGAAFSGGATDWQGYGFSGAGAQKLANNASSAAFQAGLLAGYQHRLESAPVLVGIEADINYLGDIRRNSSATYVKNTGVGLAPDGTYDFKSGRGTNYYGTVRGHLGYVMDNMQLFVSGGFAYAGNSSVNENTVTYTDALGNSVSFTGSGSNQSHTGSVFGGGFEYAFDSALAVRVEYQYISLKNSNITLTPPGGGQYYIVNDIKEKFSVARAGIIYSF
jgi:outer membrane immunogenic protein